MTVSLKLVLSSKRMLFSLQIWSASTQIVCTYSISQAPAGRMTDLSLTPKAEPGVTTYPSSAMPGFEPAKFAAPNDIALTQIPIYDMDGHIFEPWNVNNVLVEDALIAAKVTLRAWVVKDRCVCDISFSFLLSSFSDAVLFPLVLSADTNKGQCCLSRRPSFFLHPPRH